MGTSVLPDRPRPELTLHNLIRWEDHGAAWRTVEVDDDQAVVELCTCHGEPVDVVRGSAHELIEFVRSRRDDG
jgi:hypothetical protein